MRSKALLAAAIIGITNSPVLAHMRKGAYSPISIKSPKKDDEERIKKAEEKRLRKQERNLKNAKLNGL